MDYPELPQRLATNRNLTAILAGLMLGSGAAIFALLLVIGSPAVAFGAVLGIGIGLYVLTNLMAGLYATLLIVALLPFATLPVRIALTPTLIDTALGGFLLVYLVQYMTRRRTGFRFVSTDVLIAVFILFTLFSFVAGLGHTALTTSVLRQFAELLLSITMAIVLIDIARDTHTIRRLALLIIVAGAVQAIIGIALYIINDVSANQLLNSLSRFGYPSGNVLRYIEDNPDLGKRAIGTWVDPNAYGGFLMMVAALTGVQILAERPVTGRRWIALILFAPIVLTVVLTQSRGAGLALAAALLFVAVLRYRWLLVVIALSVVLIVILPFTRAYVERYLQGVGGVDLATQMRLGEYKDAFTLIGRYPLIGVGFAGTPDRDIYLGVSSMYLKIAGGTGLIGLSLFLLIMLETFRYGLVHWRYLMKSPQLFSVWFGLTAGLLGALVSGVVDHFYFNIDFQGAGMMLWLFVGLSLAAARLSKETQRITDLVER